MPAIRPMVRRATPAEPQLRTCERSVGSSDEKRQFNAMPVVSRAHDGQEFWLRLGCSASVCVAWAANATRRTGKPAHAPTVAISGHVLPLSREDELPRVTSVSRRV